MCHVLELCREFFAKLAEIDEQLARWVAARGCPKCGGPLHRGDYRRKPRGALVAVAGEAFCRRASLCCGRVGCRKRALPPSVRFLGRKVYLEAAIVVASVYVQVAGAIAQARQALGVPLRTLKRWSRWWQNDFAQSREWQAMRAQFAPPAPSETQLPLSLLQRLAGSVPDRPRATEPCVLELAAHWLLPVTTRYAL
jgi:hypothetical protein